MPVSIFCFHRSWFISAIDTSKLLDVLQVPAWHTCTSNRAKQALTDTSIVNLSTGIQNVRCGTYALHSSIPRASPYELSLSLFIFNLSSYNRPQLIGTLVNTILYTLEVVAAVIYFRSSRARNERIYITLAVLFNLAVDTVGSFSVMVSAYTVRFFSDAYKRCSISSPIVFRDILVSVSALWPLVALDLFAYR